MLTYSCSSCPSPPPPPPHGCLVSEAPTVWDPLYEQLSHNQRSLLSVVYTLGVGNLPMCYTLSPGTVHGQRWHSSTGSCTLSLSPFLLAAFLLLCIEQHTKAPAETDRTGQFNFQCAQLRNSLCACVGACECASMLCIHTVIL